MSSFTTNPTFISVDKRDIGMLQNKLSPQSMKISYEINTYKKVSADVFYIIPRGKKCIVWLTMYKGSPEVLFFDLDPRDHTKIKFISIRALHPSQMFHISDFEGRGTVLYGTLFVSSQQQVFAVENIHVYENVSVDNLTVLEKDGLLYKVFSKVANAADQKVANATDQKVANATDQKQKASAPFRHPATPETQVLFGVAVKYGTYAEALKASNTPSIIPYSVYAIQGRFRNQTDNKYYQNCQSQSQSQNQTQSQSQNQNQVQAKGQVPSKQPLAQSQTQNYTQPSTKIFMVQPEARVDMYTLRCPVTNEVESEPAHVGDYKTSALLNSIFRNVKENASLDTAEESDDEDAFQNLQELQMTGYITCSRERAMVCSYNYKFKRWVPLHLHYP